MNQQQQVGSQMAQPQFTFEGGHLVMFHNEVTGLSTKDSNVNDRDRSQDLLATEKYLTNAYDTAMNEASHDALFKVFQQNHQKCQALERQLFNTMFKKGWYRLPVADAQSVASTHSKFSQYQSQLPFKPNIQQVQQQSQTQSQSQMKQSQTQQSQSQSAADKQIQQKAEQAIQQASHGQTPQVMTRSH